MIKSININKHTVEGAINFVSSIVVYWYLIICLFGIGGVMKTSIANNLIQHDSIIQALSTIFKVHSTIIMIPMILGAIMIFSRTFKLWYFAVAIILSYWFHAYEFVDMTVHPLLFSTHIYDFLLREGQQVLNPQYTKLFLLIIIITVLLIQSCIKKYRTFDRAFITIITSVVLGTVLIFHFAIPMGMFKITKNEMQYELVEKLKYMNESDLCRERMCFTFDKDLNLLSKSQLANTEYIQRYAYYFNAVKYRLDNQHRYYIDSLGNFEGQRFDYILAATRKDNNGFFVVMDETIMKKISRSSELWFSFLASCAHVFWVFGGIGLLELHKKVLFRRRAKAEQEKQNSLNTD